LREYSEYVYDAECKPHISGPAPRIAKEPSFDVIGLHHWGDVVDLITAKTVIAAVLRFNIPDKRDATWYSLLLQHTCAVYMCSLALIICMHAIYIYIFQLYVI